MNVDFSDALQTFFAESRSLLQEMEEGLLRLESEPGDAEAINAVFRAAHTIKGSSGLFGLDGIVAFTHKAESVLDRVRNNELALNEALVSLFLDCRDHIEQLIDLAAESAEPDANVGAKGDALALRLGQYMNDANLLPVARESCVEVMASAQATADSWHISLRFGPDVLKNGMDPLSFIRYLATLGDVVHVATLDDAMPVVADMDAENCYLGFEIRLLSSADKARIESVFEFVRDDCTLNILPPGSRISDFISLIESLPENSVRLGDILVACGAITQRELDESLEHQRAHDTQDENAPPIGELLVERQVVHPELVDAALTKQKEARTRQAQEAKFVRVHADKLDSLINLVGELVIAGAGVGLMAARNKDGAMIEAVSGMARLVEDIRDGAMRLRMVEIGETFNRFRRVVRDISKELGKDIELEISGAETELDKTVVEKIGDPLTHLVRNAMDHGIESPAVRRAKGKPEKGALRLNAFHESGGIVIEVADDGAGLDRERILAKAIERGLIQDGSVLADKDVWNLIFEAGFSTAERVSNLSGRGVGMDVVRRNIEALRGSVEIESTPGVGSTFRIRLPLTLAIIDGFLMAVADTHFVVPLDMVLECVELSGGAGSDVERDYLNLRGEVLPLLNVRKHFSLQGQTSRRENVVVVSAGGRKAGLVVDELKGEFQAVIKPLGKLFERIRGISGSTILGSGEVALVLDVPVLQDEAARVDASAVMA